MFLLDIKLSAQHVHEVKRKEALKLCATWIIITGLFGLLTGYMLGKDRMIEFFTGYVIEYSLSMDNMFVFIMIFSYFGVQKKFQPKILTWVYWALCFMRPCFNFCRSGFIKRFPLLIFLFGGILISQP
jgi:tellurite resistance protein TerC